MALRVVEDATGTTWTIYEVRPSAQRRRSPRVRDVFAARWVCFHSNDERFRLPGIPDGWAQLDDPALLALMETAMRVQARAPARPPD